MQNFKAYVIGQRLQTETVISAPDKNQAIFQFAAQHGLKTYEVMVRCFRTDLGKTRREA
jgi:hypothetical protein